MSIRKISFVLASSTSCKVPGPEAKFLSDSFAVERGEGIMGFRIFVVVGMPGSVLSQTSFSSSVDRVVLLSFLNRCYRDKE